MQAGSDCISQNTFGGSRIMLNRHGRVDVFVEDQRAGVESRARRCRQESEVLGSASAG